MTSDRSLFDKDEYHTNNPSDFIITEYNALRDEILMLLRLRYEILTITLTALGAIIGYSLAVRSSFLFFIPTILMFLLIGSCLMSLFLTRHSERLGAYVSVAIEKRVKHLNWQTVASEHKRIYKPWSYTKPLALTYGILSIPPALLYVFTAFTRQSVNVSISLRVSVHVIMALLYITYFGLVMAFYFPSTRKDYKEQFNKVIESQDKELQKND